MKEEVALLSAVAVARKDTEEGGEWSDVVAVSTGHDSGNLMYMRQVVGGPGS